MRIPAGAEFVDPMPEKSDQRGRAYIAGRGVNLISSLISILPLTFLVDICIYVVFLTMRESPNRFTPPNHRTVPPSISTQLEPTHSSSKNVLRRFFSHKKHQDIGLPEIHAKINIFQYDNKSSS